ncbi:Arc family DNA-binding protein [Erwinia aphidicola]|uniref:Arc family DNA-binding protein n=1 Tax=Erwinia aphidicola TaxID=68334 RepID=A0ABU8DGQ7_ERWAP
MTHSAQRITPYPLRMSPEVREFYEGQAAENERSLNGELVRLLTERMNRVKGKKNKEQQK